MIQRKKKLVLFLPHRADPAQGVRVCADLTPLELLQIAGWPDQEGYEVVLIDAMIHPDYMARLMEACDGALLFASSCILGYQVAHGAEVARAVRERFPDLPIVWGGWFPSVLPEIYFAEGIADAVALGQGEITFWELVQALDSGADLTEVPGLVLERDGQIIQTAHRTVVGFDQYPDVPWHLLDFEKYVELQNADDAYRVRHRYPDPWGWKPGTPFRGFSYYSSFGCPEPCTFCCSPMVTNRRWKALPGKLLAERLLECHDRFGFNIVRFQDANFGVAEKRSNEFCEAIIDSGVKFFWNGTYEVETIARYKPESLDLIAEAGCSMVALGAEAGSWEQQIAIKKKIKVDDDHVQLALNRLNERGIQSGTSWIIGYPNESKKSMKATIDMAAEMKHRYPKSASDIFPFRPIPGTEDFDTAVKQGYEPPKTLADWGSCIEYKYEFDDIGLPLDVLQTWKRYGVTATFYDGLVEEGAGPVRKLLQSISGWRLRSGRYEFPIEQKLFHVYVKLLGHKPQGEKKDMTSGVTPHAPA